MKVITICEETAEGSDLSAVLVIICNTLGLIFNGLGINTFDNLYT